MLYKMHVIKRSASRCADTLRPLYKIEGPHAKEPGRRPLLTSIAAAKEWITEQIDADKMRAAYYAERN